MRTFGHVDADAGLKYHPDTGATPGHINQHTKTEKLFCNVDTLYS